jgi:hypothetical protein
MAILQPSDGGGAFVGVRVGGGAFVGVRVGGGVGPEREFSTKFNLKTRDRTSDDKTQQRKQKTRGSRQLLGIDFGGRAGSEGMKKD